jgi:hypothetical protein
MSFVHGPMYKLTLGQQYKIETREGDTVIGSYSRWLRQPDGRVSHRIGSGRSRRHVDDHAIASVTG